MTEQTPEVIDIPVVVEPGETPSRFKAFRTNHPRLVTVVSTLACVGIVTTIVSVVKASKDEDVLVVHDADWDRDNPSESVESPASKA